MIAPDPRYPVLAFETHTHLPTIQLWWSSIYRDQELPAVCVPPTGSVALYRGNPGAACWVYTTNARLAILAFAVADPTIPPSRRIHVLREAIRGALELARQHIGECGVIWSFTDNAVVARVYTELGLHNPGGTTADVFYESIGGVPTGFLE